MGEKSAVTLINSTVSGNQVLKTPSAPSGSYTGGNRGGGIYGDRVILTNSTVSDNQRGSSSLMREPVRIQSYGGGIYRSDNI